MKKLLEQKYGTQVVYKGGLRTVTTTLDTGHANQGRGGRAQQPGPRRRPGRGRRRHRPRPTAPSRRWLADGTTTSRSSTWPPRASGRRARRSRRSCSPPRLANGIPPYRAIDSDSPAVIPAGPSRTRGLGRLQQRGQRLGLHASIETPRGTRSTRCSPGLDPRDPAPGDVARRGKAHGHQDEVCRPIDSIALARSA